MEPPPPSQPPPFVGRERELGVLGRLLSEAEAGRGGVALLVGEPGIGKTRLARELASEVSRGGGLVLWGRGFEGEWPRPYGPWSDVLGGYARAVGFERLEAELGAAAWLLAPLVPGLRAARPERAPGADQERLRLYDAVAQLLLNATRERPVVLVLDDLHWADRDSLQLLRYLAWSVAQARLLIVGSYRDTEVDPEHPLAEVLAELARDGECERVFLRGLSEPGVTRYLAAAAGRELAPTLVQRIYAETDGNPFYVREVFRHLIEEGNLTVDADGALDEPGIPAGVRHVVRRRVTRLSEAAQELLRTAAAFPSGFELRLIRELVERPDDELLDLLDEGLRAGLIRAVVGRLGLYRFAHAIVRSALYEELGTGLRVRLHRRIGEALERLHGARLEPHLSELAYHFCRAAAGGDQARALRYAAAAGRRALDLMAFGESAVHFERALELLEVTDSAQRCELLLALGRARMAAGLVPAARGAYEAAAAMARSLGAAELLAQAALGVGLDFTAEVDDLEVRLLEDALRLSGDDASPTRARLLARLARALALSPDVERRVALSQEAVAMARRSGEPETLATVLFDHHMAIWGDANAQRRLTIASEVVELAERCGDRALALRGRALRLGDLLELGDIPILQAEIETYDRLTRELNQAQSLCHVPLLRATQAGLGGRFDEAERLAREGLALGQRAGDEGTPAFVAHLMAMIRYTQGRLPELEGPLREAVERYPTIPAWRGALAYALCEAGRAEQARVELDRLAAGDFARLPRDFTYPVLLTFLALTCVHLGDERRAARLYELLLPFGPCNVRVSRLGVSCLGSASYPLGLLGATLRRWDEAADHFEAALEMNVRLGAPPFLANTHYHYGRMLLARGRPGDAERAREHLERAATLARALGIRLQLESPGRSHGTAPAPTGGANVLTRREREVAVLVGRGLSNREIGEALTISERTAEMHVGNILGKLGVTTRAQAAVWAAEHGLLVASSR